MIVWLAVIVSVVLLDQLTKILTVAHLLLGESFPFIPNVFHFTYIQNRGAAFGMLSEHRWVFMILSCAAIVLMLFYLWKYRPKNRWMCAAISMIIGGGIGNMIDRIRLGYVVDFLDFCAFPTLWRWTFNVADAFVCVGAGIMVVSLLVSAIQDARKAKREKEATVEESPCADGSEEETAPQTEDNEQEP